MARQKWPSRWPSAAMVLGDAGAVIEVAVASSLLPRLRYTSTGGVSGDQIAVYDPPPARSVGHSASLRAERVCWPSQNGRGLSLSHRPAAVNYAMSF